ncbi:MAG: DNA-directed RNA polymerase subunit beta [Clostridiales bacterium]|jgi:DNA-directed RNA polymerase subunit beta|nr:DNA-directed RNA polymerase subunit beta [Clostridiales bacterium]
MGQKAIKKVRYGKTERMSFAGINEVIDMPFLIEVQKSSYDEFLGSGIAEVFKDFSPITDISNRIELHFLDHRLEHNLIKYTEKECKDRDATYAAPLKVNVRQVKTETGEVIEQEVYMGDFPLMTPNGSFIINGAERVVVSQLVRSPGVYFDYALDQRTGQARYGATNIPSRGAWLEFSEDDKGVLWVQVDRTRKVQASVLMRTLYSITNDPKFLANEKRAWINNGLKYGADEEINAVFHNEKVITDTTEKDGAKTLDDAIIELNRKLRPGEVPNVDSIKTHIENLFFDRRKYDLSRVGRYKYNKKLALAARIAGQTAAADVVDADGICYVRAGGVIEPGIAAKIQNSGLNEVAVEAVSVQDGTHTVHTVIGNAAVDLAEYIDVDPLSIGINEKVYYPVLHRLIERAKGDRKALADLCAQNKDRLIVRHILVDDIIATINYILGLRYGIGQCDNIDHLGNRRVRSVGELLQNQFRVGIARLERVVRERMQIQKEDDATPASLINIRPVSSAIKEFFGSSQLSQFMDEVNPIAELTHKRKLSALGPGGLNRERASFEVRDVHYTHYSRMCPIETPEGQNIGLISSLSSYARINEYGFIEAPYRRVDKINKRVTDEVHYLAADEEDRYSVAQATEPLDENGWFVNERVLMRRYDDISEKPRDEIDYMDVSPRQMISVATALIPFLENDDTNRALMGSNMQRQAVPLLKPEAPIVGTGIEHKIAYDSGVMVLARKNGAVEYADADEIRVKEDDGKRATYTLKKFIGSNQGTCINQRPLVCKGDKVKQGQVLADGHSTEGAELALGRNILIGFMAWEGYNYEDAILVSEKIVKDDVFTSIHIEEHELEARDTKLGEEEITRDIPNVGEDALKNLDECGIIRIGAEVDSGDILVGKVTPKGETELTPEERLLRAIFGEKAREVRDTSLRVPHGEGGIVVDVKKFTRKDRDEMSPGVNELVRVYIAQKRKISVGDKMAGRHGNKGVISRILPEEDMPFMADGTPLQIVLNPLGVPSRMNIGQVLEVHLGLVAKALGWKVATPVFDGAVESGIKELLEQNKLGLAPDGKVDGKVQMFDGRTGEAFENRATVGYMYMIKLIHLVDDKIHARSTGPYSLVTQQPLGGKAQIGGQRFGEMEVWALYAYGAANILQEIMTVKSDDIVGRVKTYESIVKGLNVSEPGVPESFKVLIKELQALALDVKVLTEDKVEIGIRDLIEDEADTIDTPDDRRRKPVENGVLTIREPLDPFKGKAFAKRELAVFEKEVDPFGANEPDKDIPDDEEEFSLVEDDEVDFTDPFADRILTDEDDILDDEPFDDDNAPASDAEPKKKSKKKNPSK